MENTKLIKHANINVYYKASHIKTTAIYLIRKNKRARLVTVHANGVDSSKPLANFIKSNAVQFDLKQKKTKNENILEIRLLQFLLKRQSANSEKNSIL